MRFIIDDSIESMIRRIAGPVQIIRKDKKDYEIKNIPIDKEEEVRRKVKEYIESKGMIYDEIS